MNTEDMIPTSGEFQNPETGEALWKELEDTAYERIITSQHDFVRFMQNLHVPDDTILFPPEGGWPQITKESFASLGKSDKAIEVLRNMAYIKDPMDSEPREILLETALYDYTESGVVEQITAGNGADTIFRTEPIDEPAPRDVVGLTVGGRECGIILLDCRYGIVRYPNCGRHTDFGHRTRGDPSGEGNEDWGGETAWPVEEFFDFIKQKFLNFEQLAFNQSCLVRKDFDIFEVFEACKEIYQKHGFPGADYDKDACMEELDEYCETKNV